MTLTEPVLLLPNGLLAHDPARETYVVRPGAAT